MDAADYNDELRDVLIEIQERVGTIYHFGVLPLYCTDEWVCGCFEKANDYPEVAGDTPMEAARKLLEQVSGDSADYLKPEEEVAAMDADLADLIERGREAAALDHTCMTADRMMWACDAKQSALRDLLTYVEAWRYRYSEASSR